VEATADRARTSDLQSQLIFNHNQPRSNEQPQAREAELFEQIGRLKMELEWLKKKAAPFS
jgi:hypothetical protein